MKLAGNWTARNVLIAVSAVASVGKKLSTVIEGTAAEAFKSAYNASSDNPLVLFWGSADDATQGVNLSDECTGITAGGCTTSSHLINFMSLSEETVSGGGGRTVKMAAISAINNIVHELGHAFGNRFKSGSNGPYEVMNMVENNYLIDDDGFYPSPKSASRTWRQHPITDPSGDPGNEAFADMFLGWTYGMWANTIEGRERNDFMTTNMAEWVAVATGQ